MTADALHGEVLLPGAAEGAVLKLDRPISFWGGVDPESGRISDPRHPQHGQAVELEDCARRAAGQQNLASERVGGQRHRDSSRVTRRLAAVATQSSRLP